MENWKKSLLLNTRNFIVNDLLLLFIHVHNVYRTVNNINVTSNFV